MIQEFKTMDDAAAFAARHFEGCDDCNPIPVVAAGRQWHVCGPTTGEWLGQFEGGTIVRIGDLTFSG